MEPTPFKRKLAVILAADVVGYSRLMHADEEATVKTLSEYREIMNDFIVRHEGRVLDMVGDAALAEFGSAVEAVRCAIAIQEEIATRNVELPDDRKLRFRIGINVGDVLVKGDTLYGDGVNVAARLEALAEPGGICTSDNVFNQVKHKMSIGFEGMGPQEVKNISEPVDAFRIVPAPVSVAASAEAAYCAMYNLTQGRYVAPFVILTLQGLTLELKEGNNGRVHHGTTIQAGVFTIHL